MSEDSYKNHCPESKKNGKLKPFNESNEIPNVKTDVPGFSSQLFEARTGNIVSNTGILLTSQSLLADKETSAKLNIVEKSNAYSSLISDFRKHMNFQNFKTFEETETLYDKKCGITPKDGSFKQCTCLEHMSTNGSQIHQNHEAFETKLNLLSSRTNSHIFESSIRTSTKYYQQPLVRSPSIEVLCDAFSHEPGVEFIYSYKTFRTSPSKLKLFPEKFFASDIIRKKHFEKGISRSNEESSTEKHFYNFHNPHLEGISDSDSSSIEVIDEKRDSSSESKSSPIAITKPDSSVIPTEELLHTTLATSQPINIPIRQKDQTRDCALQNNFLGHPDNSSLDDISDEIFDFED